MHCSRTSLAALASAPADDHVHPPRVKSPRPHRRRGGDRLFGEHAAATKSRAAYLDHLDGENVSQQGRATSAARRDEEARKTTAFLGWRASRTGGAGTHSSAQQAHYRCGADRHPAVPAGGQPRAPLASPSKAGSTLV